MDRAQLPWRTGEDRRSLVLDRVIQQAVQRPEIAAELAPGGNEIATFNAAHKIVSEAWSSVIAQGDTAEMRYRALARQAKHPVIAQTKRYLFLGEPFTLVLIPTSGIVLLLAYVAFTGSVLSLLSGAIVVGAFALLIVLSMMRITPSLESMSIANSIRARSWAVFCMLFLVIYGPLVTSHLPWWLGLGITGAGMPGGLVVWGAATAIFPTEKIRLRRRAALSAFEEWGQTLLRDGVLPVLFAKINAASVQTYFTTLTARETGALTRANPVTMHVPTPASRKLTRLVDQLGGGSFALAGPRGAGKSNLLKAFCGGRYRDENRHPDLAVLVSAPVEYVPHEFVLHLFGATCRAAIKYPGQLAVPARDNLNLLSYVHSYAREVTAKGGVKGFELGRKRGVTLQGRALTYPELVDRFREFLRDAVTALIAESKQDGKEPGRVVIAIDELDRLGSSEPARRFLNELKAIFDVTGCYYLVSVSTEAQHDFELSGNGQRGVFDSSFDEFVRVDYLDFEHAKKLLRRYVIGLSEQFLALAYVFSGGLARQLVRIARVITEHGREHPGAPLPAVAGELARIEMITTCQAAGDVLASAGVTELVRVLDDPPMTIAGNELRAYADRVSLAYEGDSEQVHELRDGVRERMCFLATILDLFTNDLTERRMLDFDFDALARDRRYLGG